MGPGKEPHLGQVSTERMLLWERAKGERAIRDLCADVLPWAWSVSRSKGHASEHQDETDESPWCKPTESQKKKPTQGPIGGKAKAENLPFLWGLPFPHQAFPQLPGNRKSQNFGENSCGHVQTPAMVSRRGWLCNKQQLTLDLTVGPVPCGPLTGIQLARQWWTDDYDRPGRKFSPFDIRTTMYFSRRLRWRSGPGRNHHPLHQKVQRPEGGYIKELTIRVKIYLREN